MTKLEKEIEKEKQIIREHSEKLSQLREREDVEIHIPKLNKQVGKCFKFKNSCGGPETWWLYMRILGVEDSCGFLMEEFEELVTDCRRLSFQTVLRTASFVKDPQYKKIPESEYLLARKNFFDKIGR
jgi:hypothetical protein